jgi:D-3-phosphoglycerate dehydrogenase
MKVLVTPRSFGKTDPGAFEILREAGLEVVVNESGGILDREALSRLLADCDGVVLGVDMLDAETLAAAPKLRAVAKYGVGVDNIALDECERRGVKVSRTVGANSDAVADYTFALLLAAARRVTEIDAQCRRKDWSKITGTDVCGKTLGLIGFGAIGKRVAARAAGFDMEVRVYDTVWDESGSRDARARRASLEEIFTESDFISLHVPLTEETRGMIGKEQMKRMKPGVILINTARGGVIDESALLEALKNGTVRAAGIDAFEEEPPGNPEWYGLKNLVMGAHSAASTDGATKNMGRMAAMNLVRDLGIEPR